MLLPIIGNGNVNILLKNVKTTIYTKFSLKNLPEVSDLTYFITYSKLIIIILLKNIGSNKFRSHASGIRH